MATLRELVTKITYETNTKPLELVAKSVDGIRQRMDLLVGAEMIRGLAALTDRFGNFALDLRASAAAAGITTDEFQKLAYAAAQNGINQDALGKTLGNLNKKLQEARLGSEEANLAFSRAGLAPEQIGSFRNAEDALYGLAQGLNSIQDPIQRAAASEAILGEAGTRLLATVNAGNKGLYALSHSAEAAQNALSPGVLTSLVESEQAMASLRAATQTFVAQLVGALAPAITQTIKGITAFMSNIRALVSTKFDRFVYNIGYAMGFAKGVLEDVSLVIIQTVRYLADWGERLGLWNGIKRGFELLGDAAVWAFSSIIDLVTDVVSILGKLGAGLGETASDMVELFKTVIGWADKASLTLLHMAQDILHGPLGDIPNVLRPFVWLLREIVDLLASDKLANSPLGRLLEGVGNLAATLFGSGSLAKMRDMGDWLVGTNAATQVQVLDPLRNKMPVYDPNPLQNAQAMANMQAKVSTQLPQGGAQDPSARVNYSVQAPVTINVAGQADPQKLYEAVQDGMADHHDKVLRQAQASLNQAVVF